jgi:hypothetical protein
MKIGRISRLLDSAGALPLDREMSKPPNLTPQKSAARAAREERLAKALRDNLRRRKEQARAQAQPGARQSERQRDGGGEPPA